jgi:Ca2+-binding EF-hand superfamily protein
MMRDVMFVRLLKQADTNKDGKISKEELTARQEALFTEIDLNKDGSITRGEMVDFRDNKMAEFRKNNAPPTAEEAEDDGPDADGPLAEGPEDEGPKADGLKADGPRADREQAREDRRERREARRDRGPRGGPGDGMMGPGMFRMIDENRDRKISKEEAAAATEKLFARMDTNTDGQITIDDLPDRPL